MLLSIFQIERGKGVGTSQEHVATELVRSNDSDQIKLNLALKKKTEDEEKAKRLAPAEFRVPVNKKAHSSSGSSYGGTREKGEKRKASALDEIIKEEEHRKENAHRKPNWLTEVPICTLLITYLGVILIHHENVLN